jgi:hypothetical protein
LAAEPVPVVSGIAPAAGPVVAGGQPAVAGPPAVPGATVVAGGRPTDRDGAIPVAKSNPHASQNRPARVPLHRGHASVGTAGSGPDPAPGALEAGPLEAGPEPAPAAPLPAGAAAADDAPMRIPHTSQKSLAELS